jgi:transcription termination factor NusB
VPCVWALLVEINKKKRVVEKIRNIVISQLYQIEMRKKKESEQVQLFVYVCFIYLVTNESLTRLNISWIVVTSAINNLSAWNKYFQS